MHAGGIDEAETTQQGEQCGLHEQRPSVAGRQQLRRRSDLASGTVEPARHEHGRADQQVPGERAPQRPDQRGGVGARYARPDQENKRRQCAQPEQSGEDDGCSVSALTTSSSAPLHLFIPAFIMVAARFAVRRPRKVDTRLAGDCVAPRNLFCAIHEGEAVALAL